MKVHYLFLLLSVLIATTIASDTDSSDSEPLYHELYRPAYHYSPPSDWMNDPVGLVYFDGQYHFFYQYNPFSTDWGDMSWGHAVSTDLVHWDTLPVAIPEYNGIMIFSGSIIVDVNNTSGFCDPTNKEGCLLAYYTAHTDTGEGQAFAYSNDHALTFVEYPYNPIIQPESGFFRDPKVVWYEPEEKWVMVTAVPLSFKCRFYTSKDLIHWTLMSEFGPEGSEEGGWEDPDLFALLDEEGNKKWILSHAVAVNKVEYYIGQFNGTHFVNTDTANEILLIDYGKDFCEAATWNNEPNNRRLMIAWLDDGAYGGLLPTKVWRGQHTMIRELTLRTYPEGPRIVQSPLPEMTQLRTSPNHYDSIQLNKTNHIFALPSGGTQLEIFAEFTYSHEMGDVPLEFGINVFVGGSQRTVIGYDVDSEQLFVDRTFSGLTNFSNMFTAISYQKLAPENGVIKLHIFVDHSTVEVFANDGKVAMTNLIFSDPTLDQVQIYTVGGDVTVTSMDTWVLNSIWDSVGQKVKVTE